MSDGFIVGTLREIACNYPIEISWQRRGVGLPGAVKNI